MTSETMIETSSSVLENVDALVEGTESVPKKPRTEAQILATEKMRLKRLNPQSETTLEEKSSRRKQKREELELLLDERLEKFHRKLVDDLQEESKISWSDFITGISDQEDEIDSVENISSTEKSNKSSSDSSSENAAQKTISRDRTDLLRPPRTFIQDFSKYF